MSFTWHMHPGTDAESVQFPSQAEAESWLGESWPELVDQGVDAVSLYEFDRLVYGPMSLHPGP